MRQIRKNTFETNSSSTHAIAFSNEYRKYTKEDLLKLTGIFKPFTAADIDEDLYIYDKLEDKLRWLLSSIAQYNPQDDIDLPIKQLLKEVLPNATLIYHGEKDFYYELEDIDIMWEDWGDGYPGQLLENAEVLEEFLLEGVVIWGNRDRCSIDRTMWYSDVEITLRKFENIVIKFTG